MTAILLAVAFLFGLTFGFFLCSMCAVSRMDDMERMLAHFACTGNWRIVHTASNVLELAWNGPTNHPWELAREALQ